MYFEEDANDLNLTINPNFDPGSGGERTLGDGMSSPKYPIDSKNVIVNNTSSYDLLFRSNALSFRPQMSLEKDQQFQLLVISVGPPSFGRP